MSSHPSSSSTHSNEPGQEEETQNILLYLPRVTTSTRNTVTPTATEKHLLVLPQHKYVFLKTARKKVCVHVRVRVPKGCFSRPKPFPCPSAQVSRDDAGFLI